MREHDVRKALERASLYRLLGLAFAYPDPGRMAALAGLADGVGSARVAEAVRDALAAFAAAVREADPDDVADQYVFLFDRGARCPPYEGAYGDAPRMAGKAAMLADIGGFYAAFGLTPAVSRPDMEDHIAAELEFMSALALKEAYALAEAQAEAVEITRRAQISFLSDHLGGWTEVFASTLKDATSLPYYRELAGLLEAWMTVEVGALGATPVRLRTAAREPAEEDALTCPMAEPLQSP